MLVGGAGQIKITKDGWIAPRFERANTNAYLFYGGYKLERGKIPSDWSPSPEDTQEQFNSLNSSLSQKQDVLTAGSGITIQGNTISASAPVQGASVSIKDFTSPGGEFHVYKHTVTIGQKTLTTFSFECFTETPEHVLTGELKEELGKFIGIGYSVSNGALSISHEVDVMKLLNSTPEYHNNQHATFTFYKYNAGGGGGTQV